MASFGVLFGVGASLAYVPSLAIIGHYYKKYIGIANGIVTLGSSLFSIAMPYVLGSLVNIGLPMCLRYVAFSDYSVFFSSRNVWRVGSRWRLLLESLLSGFPKVSDKEFNSINVLYSV